VRLTSTAIIIILFIAIVVILLSGFSHYPSKIILKFYRTGGIIGEREEIIVYSDGRVSYIAEKKGISLEKKLSPDTFSELKVKVSKILPYCGETFKAKNGAADYFTYTLEMEKCKIIWVDEWIARNPLPSELIELQSFFKKLFEEV